MSGYFASRWAVLGLVAPMVVALAVGCTPPPPTADDLGQIVYDASQVPGYDRPYKLPHGLGEQPQSEQGHEAAPGDAATPPAE